MQLLKKGIVISIIIIFIIQFIAPTVSVASMTEEQKNALQGAIGDYVDYNVSDPSEANRVASAGTSLGDRALTIGLGILYLPFQYIIGLITTILELIAEGITDKDIVTPQDVIFNDVDLVDINFFSQDSSVQFVKTIRDNVASWYYGIRTIAIIASLCVLIYIAIRMVIAATGEEKGKFKTMFKDWLVSFVLLFVLHYIMLLIIYGNDVLVDVFKTSLTTGNTQTALTEYMQSMRNLKWSVDVTIPVAQKFGANVVCLLMAGLTLGFIIMYVKRFIVVAFLMMISPIITITYAIDKVKDSKSQALDAWIKEYFWTIVIQPFHCLIYLVFVPAALTLLQNGDVGSSFMAIFCMLFILQAEGIVKNIFGIKAEDIGGLSAASALVAGGFIGSLNKVKAPKLQNPDKGAGKKGEKGKGLQGPTGHASPTPNGGGSPVTNQSPTDKTTQPKDSTNNRTQPSPIDNANNTNNNKSPFNQMDNRFMNSEKVQDSMEKFANALRGSAMVQGATKVIKGYTKAALGVALASLSLLENPDGAKTFTAFMGGRAAGEAAFNAVDQGKNWAANKLQLHVENGRLQNREADFDNAYQALRSDNSGNISTKLTEEKIREFLNTDLTANLDSKFTEAERRMALATQRLYSQLEKMEYDDPLEEVVSRVRLKDNEN